MSKFEPGQRASKIATMCDPVGGAFLVQSFFVTLHLNFSDPQYKHLKSAYGEFHPGRELTAIEMENFWFAVKPIHVWIYFKDFCALVYVSIFLAKWSSSILFTSFTC